MEIDGKIFSEKKKIQQKDFRMEACLECLRNHTGQHSWDKWTEVDTRRKGNRILDQIRPRRIMSFYVGEGGRLWRILNKGLMQ